MKKIKYIIISLVVILIIAGVLVFFYETNSKYEFNTKTFNINELSEESYIEIDNLRITLRKVCFGDLKLEDLDGFNIEEVTSDNIIKFADSNKVNFFVEIETIDQTPLSEIDFGYAMFDKSNNELISNSGVDLKELHAALIERENFESKDGYFGNTINTDGGSSKIIVNELPYSENSVLWHVRANTKMEATEENKIDLSKVNLIIAGIRYRDSEYNIVELKNKAFEFVIEN